ncbi:hypothetical protein BST97_15205 [Nonlabens spongiae]|uniref:Ig-like domain-containing protein n=1 Tax=Nonlabens spongiae TaxID=331648 RepID=A0A1W6MNN2_9FLAO|nr:Calx-beta domain-containing protein [Nonlabens spongiae]ARN79223.1 hypothetical protein BST97_15205 [Nonlabens spongiae]
MKQLITFISVISMLFVSVDANSQTVFDLSPETTTDNTPTNVQETVDGITMTVSAITTSGPNTLFIASAPSGFGTVGLAVHSSASQASRETIVSFSSSVDVASINVASGALGSRTWTFTPTGGSNSAVTETRAFDGNHLISLNFTGITAITITSSRAGVDAEQIGVDKVTLAAPTCNLSASITSLTNVNCNGDSTGSLTVTASSGTANYNYSWTRNGSSYTSVSGSSSNSNTISNLPAGVYEVTVEDSNGCTDTTSATITQPTALSATITSQFNVTCNGGNDGRITISPSGGTSPYSYEWNDSQTTATASGLAAGVYSVTVTDALGCQTTANNITVTEPMALSATASGTNPTTPGGIDGTVTASVTGGTGPFTYLWNIGATTETITGLAAGTYTVTVRDRNNCLAADSSVTLTDPKEFSINDSSIAEGNSGTSPITFTVSLSSPAPAGGATVDYATSDDTATSGSDYVPSSGTLSFSVGETSKTIDVSALGDLRVEADETFNLTLSNPTGTNVNIGDATGTGTITNNDSATVTIADVNVNEGSRTATVRLVLNNAVQGGLSVGVSTSDATATAGQDYTAVTSASETFAGTAGEEETLTVSITNDAIVENDETISVAMSNLVPTNSGIDPANINITDTATITVFDNDTATVTIADVSGNEDDGAITVTVTVDNAVDGGFDVNVNTADGTTTTANNDYFAVVNQTLNFAGTAGESETFTITPIADSNIEQNETLTVSMSSLVPVTVSSSDINITDTATVTILNDDFVNGLQVAAMDTVYLIDFDNTVAGVNNGEFEGGGLSPSPASGQLDSNGLRIEGLSDGDTSFGGSHASGDFTRGGSTGGVSTGGLYAFDVSNGGTSDIALGVQPVGSDFTPGAIILKFENRTGSTITDLNIAYEVLVRNNEARGNSITFETGSDFNNTTAVNGLDYETPAATDGIFNTSWRRSLFQTNVSVSIADGAEYYLKWNSDDATGSGNRDEFAIDDIQIVANSNTTAPVVTGDFEDLFIDGTYSLQNTVNVEGRLNVSGGSLVTNDNLTMKSINYSGTIRTAILDPVLNGGSINGNVTVEQFYPANRAFRFVNSPVLNISSTIFDNWQEGGSNTPGFGTQITGGTASDGFDQSTSNNPSAFLYDPTGTSGTTGWIAMGSTPSGTFVPNQTPLLSSFGFRLLIRGDRTVSLTDQNAPATSTVLRSTGSLVTGDYTVDGDMFSSQIAFGADGSFYLAPNPYQAQVDLAQALNGTNSEDINQGTYWFYQPATQNYVAYDLVTGGVQNGVSQFIQPGQAFFVQTDEASGSTAGYAPSFTYTEFMKSTDVTATATYSQPAGSYTIRMFTPETMGGAIATDMVRGFINPGFANGIDTGDALKITGESEQLGILSNGTLLSNERREAFMDGEVVPLQISQMDNGSYSFELNFQLPDHEVYLVDNHLNTRVLIDQSQITNYSFDVDLSDAGSFAADRFQLEFETVTLSSGDLAFAKAVQLYPNPVTGDVLNISGLQAGDVELTITNMLGQRVTQLKKSTTNGSVEVLGNDAFDAGVYLITIVQNGQSTTKRFIIK